MEEQLPRQLHQRAKILRILTNVKEPPTCSRSGGIWGLFLGPPALFIRNVERECCTFYNEIYSRTLDTFDWILVFHMENVQSHWLCSRHVTTKPSTSVTCHNKRQSGKFGISIWYRYNFVIYSLELSGPAINWLLKLVLKKVWIIKTVVSPLGNFPSTSCKLSFRLNGTDTEGGYYALADPTTTRHLGDLTWMSLTSLEGIKMLAPVSLNSIIRLPMVQHQSPSATSPNDEMSLATTDPVQHDVHANDSDNTSPADYKPKHSSEPPTSAPRVGTTSSVKVASCSSHDSGSKITSL